MKEKIPLSSSCVFFYLSIPPLPSLILKPFLTLPIATTKHITGLQNLGGSVSKTYENWRQQLISGLAHAEAVIDFGDDEHLVSGADQDDHDGENNGNDYYEQQQQMVWGDVATKMHNLQSSMEEQLQDGRRGELIREGITVAIVGKFTLQTGAGYFIFYFVYILSVAHNILIFIKSMFFDQLKVHQMQANHPVRYFYVGGVMFCSVIGNSERTVLFLFILFCQSYYLVLDVFISHTKKFLIC